MAEWLIAPILKIDVALRSPGVRIPPFPKKKNLGKPFALFKKLKFLTLVLINSVFNYFYLLFINNNKIIEGMYLHFISNLYNSITKKK